MTPDPVPLFGPEMRLDPYPLYHKLRAESPVYWSETAHAWILTSFDAVAAALNDLRFSSARAQHFQALAHNDELRPFFSFLGVRMNLTDPPQHTRLRALVSKAFTPHTIEAMRPHIQQLVDGFLDAVVPSGRADLVRDLAFPLPATVILELLGVPPEDRRELKKLSDDFVVFISTHPAHLTTEHYRRAQASMRAMIDYFGAALPKIRASGKSCLLLTMALAEDAGDQLSHEELFANANLLMVAGHETTTNLIGNAVVALLHNPEQLALLRADPSRMPAAVEEALRYNSAVQFTHRIALDDIVLGGKTIRKGDLVFCFLAAANRDPAVFPDPDRFDIRRASHKHLALGLGHHFCLGAPLARLEAQIALGAIVQRLQNLRLAGDHLEYSENFNLRGVTALPIEFG